MCGWNRNLTTEGGKRKLKYPTAVKSLKGVLEKIKHDSSERCAVKGQEADTDFSNGIFNCITGEDVSQ